MIAQKETCIPEKSVFAADRGYGGWRVYVSLNELDRKYIIREKDKDSQGTFAAMNLSEEEEFDIVKTIILTNKQTKETLGNPDLYRLVMSNQNFPYLDIHALRTRNSIRLEINIQGAMISSKISMPERRSIIRKATLSYRLIPKRKRRLGTSMQRERNGEKAVIPARYWIMILHSGSLRYIQMEAP